MIGLPRRLGANGIVAVLLLAEAGRLPVAVAILLLTAAVLLATAAALLAAAAVLLFAAARLLRTVLFRGLAVRSRRRAAVRCRNGDPDQLLDVAQISPLLVIAEGDRGAVRAGTRGAADPVHVALRNVRQIVVDHVA